MAQVPPRNPKYTQADLWPPGSKENVDFPPAAFHPVYLGNFLCQQQQEMVPRVQQYFASKGLLARMVFVRSPENDPFRNYQDKTKLYDCLVYFTRQADAEDAVKYLHRDKYYGHRLNIFPGRTADQMDPCHSVGYVLTDAVSRWPNTLIEDHIEDNTCATIIGSRRLTGRHLIVEYASKRQLRRALQSYPYLEPYPITEEVIHHQRFVERNVTREIRDQLKNTPFMEMGPEKHLLDALCNGASPDVSTDWAESTDLPVLEIDNLPDAATLRNICAATLKNFGFTCNFRQRPRKMKRKRAAALEEPYAKLRVQLPWRAAME